MGEVICFAPNAETNYKMTMLFAQSAAKGLHQALDPQNTGTMPSSSSVHFAVRSSLHSQQVALNAGRSFAMEALKKSES